MPADCDLLFSVDPATSRVNSVTLYGEELLNPGAGGQTDLYVNGLPLKTRPHPDPVRGDNKESGA